MIYPTELPVFGVLPNLESRQALDLAIQVGRGGVFLNLTDELGRFLNDNGRDA